MNETELIDISREAIMLTIKIGAPVMLVGLIVGVAIALVQALTQIQAKSPGRSIFKCSAAVLTNL